MSETRRLLPPAHVIHERLTLIAREQRILRTILRWIIEAERDDERTPSEPHQQAPGREGGHAD
jgi:hypothetical protein